MKVLGIDFGTTSICAVVLHGESGAVLETVTLDNDAQITTGKSWEALQDASVIWAKAKQLVNRLINDHRPIQAIGLTGQMHGIVYVNKSGEAVSPLYSWQDGRGDLILTDETSYAAALSETSGYNLSTGFGAVTHAYNVRKKLIPSDAVKFCTIHDYIAMRLTGRTTPLIHSSDAASIGLYDLRNKQFDFAAIEKCELKASFFPEVTSGFDILGNTSEGIPVITPIGDNQASFIGSVRDMSSSLVLNVGTSGQISLLAQTLTAKEKPMSEADGADAKSVLNSSLELRPLTANQQIVVGAALCGGKSYALLEKFYRSVLSMAGLDEISLYKYMDTLSESFDDLEDKLTVNTRFNGTRVNPEERASIGNIGSHNFDARHLTVGILEGIIEELHDNYNLLSDKPSITTLIGSGNALRKSLVLQKIATRRFGLELHIPAHSEEAAYGSGLTALTGIGFYEKIEDAQKLIKFEDEP